MKNIFILLILIGAFFQGLNYFSPSVSNIEPLYAKPYIVVYGRNTCGVTQKAMRGLKEAGIPFEYKNIDDKSVEDILHKRMDKSGLDIRWYNLPVVDVNNKLSIRPDIRSTIDEYNESLIDSSF